MCPKAIMHCGESDSSLAAVERCQHHVRWIQWMHKVWRKRVDLNIKYICILKPIKVYLFVRDWHVAKKIKTLFGFQVWLHNRKTQRRYPLDRMHQLYHRSRALPEPVFEFPKNK
jgi:hypothetical protein